MEEEIITTNVDNLINLLKGVDTIELSAAAKKLGMPFSVVQSWVEFLVEENIIGLEYKFTTPYIYLNKEKEQTKIETIKKESKNVAIHKLETEFRRKAAEKKISKEHATNLWKNHVFQKMEKKKEFFVQEARKKGLLNYEELWEEYKIKLTNM
ncbi:MAG: hypothetical protein ABIB43_00670 [archaeon]